MMANYVLAYRGGGMPESEEERQRVGALWGAWFGSLGAAIVDAGNPFAGPSKTVESDGSASDGGASELGGYSILSADDIDAAVLMAQGCPQLSSGGSVEVYEVTPVM